MITQHIVDLLQEYECVIVPGFGGFIKANLPAEINSSSQEIYPPSSKIAFNAGLSANDGLLANYISLVENKLYRDALYEINIWVENCKKKLAQNEHIFIEGVGEFTYNEARKIEFHPSNPIKCNANSFGLPIISIQSLGKDNLPIQITEANKNQRKSFKIIYLIQESLKWAAVIAPFSAMLFWGTQNRNMLQNYVQNYTGMYVWENFTSGKTAPESNISTKKTIDTLSGKSVFTLQTAFFLPRNSSSSPASISYNELTKQNIKILSDTLSISHNTNPLNQFHSKISTSDYHIIGGAFRNKANAAKFIEQISIQGFDAQIIDTTPSGLYVVSMQGFEQYRAAEIKLNVIKKSGFEHAWIFKRKKT